MGDIFAVLLEVVSIQKYVFGSNKLKENLGGSWLIQEVFETPLRTAAITAVPTAVNYDFNAWRDSPDEIQITKGSDFEVGYIGGGNALLFFRHPDNAKCFVTEWTKMLLVQAPGVMTAVACDKFKLGDFKSGITRMFTLLRQQKQSQVPLTVIPRHGITAECPRSGYSMDVWRDMNTKYVSSVTNAKLAAAEEANKKLSKDFSENLRDEYCYSDEFDKLGQKTGESHIAIVHIDGNGMGKRFHQTMSLPSLRDLSKTVKIATQGSFASVLDTITSRFEDIFQALGYKSRSDYDREHNEKGRPLLPIRPIIIGGDDITFVSDGRLGVYFAKLFLEAFESQTVSEGEKLSACAGIAITKTKYPFYRGYQLSEELCGNAKSIRKKQNNDGSWLDFHISYGGFSGPLDRIRKDHYIAP